MNEARQVIVFPRGQLHPKDREKLTKLGFVAVEADDPSAVVVILPSSPVASGDDILLAALAGLGAPYGQGHQVFGKTLRERIEKRLTESVAPNPSK